MNKTIEISRDMFDRMINALEDSGWYNLANEAAKDIAEHIGDNREAVVATLSELITDRLEMDDPDLADDLRELIKELNK